MVFFNLCSNPMGKIFLLSKAWENSWLSLLLLWCLPDPHYFPTLHANYSAKDSSLNYFPVCIAWLLPAVMPHPTFLHILSSHFSKMLTLHLLEHPLPMILSASFIIDSSSALLTHVFFFFLFFLNCSGFCHTLKWNSHGFTCVPHTDPPSHLPLYPNPLGLPSAPGPSACLMRPCFNGVSEYKWFFQLDWLGREG